MSAKSYLIPATLGALGIFIHGASIASESEVANVKHTITTMLNAIDTKQWPLAEAQFTENVFTDYSSLTGQAGGLGKTSDLVNGWQSRLSNVSTHHLLGNFDISVDGNRAEAWSHVYASHFADGLEPWDAIGRYHHKLRKINDLWKITAMTLHMHGQKGNANLLQQVSELSSANSSTEGENTTSKVKRVEFLSQGENVVGDLYLPSGFDASKQYPAIIVSGSWTTVKEQMAGLYASKMAEQGFIALAFDFRNFGESGGDARFYENPVQKVEDIRSAVSFMQRLSIVDQEKIGAMGICAGAMYTLMAASEDNRIKSVVTAASWLHDADAVELFYGGKEGVSAKINAAQAAKINYEQTGVIDYIPSISTTDEQAAMYGPYDYYLNPERGAVEQWSDDKFAVMSWEDWLTVNPMPSAEKLNTPTLMIHSDGAVLPEYTKRYFNNIASDNKKLHWLDTELESPFHQFNFYDQDAEVTTSVEQASLWFHQNL